MLGSSRQSLIRRIIEIAQKPHGESRVETAKSILSPLRDPWVVESAVSIVTSPRYEWQKRYIQRSIEGTCAALAQDSTHPNCIKRFCQLVSEGKVSRATSAMSRQCFHHLLPAIAKHKRLHLSGRKLVDEMLRRQLVPSTEMENCLTELYRSAECTADLVKVIEGMRRQGLTPSRPLYKKVLSLVMSVERRDSSKSDSKLRQVTACMAADWGEKETEGIIYLTALGQAWRESQVENIWDSVKTSGVQLDEECSHCLIEAYLRATAKRTRKARVWSAVCCLRELASKRVPVSVGTFDSILAACIETGQLNIALDVFKCMIAVYGLAPTRKGYSSLIKIVSTTHSLYKNPVLFRKALQLCSQILGDAVAAYAGNPPPWVYTETAKPLTQLLGVPGYQKMYELWNTATAKGPFSFEDPAYNDGSCWNIAAYNSLLQACQITRKDKAVIGMYLFGELLNQGLQPDEETFFLVLGLVHNQHDIRNDDFIHLITCMSSLPASKIQDLQEPLLAALCRIYTKEQDWLKLNRGDGILLAAAAKGMVHSAISSTHHYCIEQIDRVCAAATDSSTGGEDQGYRSDGDDTEELQCVGLS